MSRDDFDKQLAFGRIGEKLVERLMHERGSGTVPSYEFSGANGTKAPRLTFLASKYVIPDLDVCKDGRRFWAEVKTYNAPAPNRRFKCDVHGIPLRLFNDYLLVETVTGCPVYILILEVQSGILLSARMRNLFTFTCQCGPCEDNRDDMCWARGKGAIRGGIYWRRDHMKEIHRYPDNDMTELRALREAA